jgi:methionyl-tRNA synthetase
MSNNHNQKFYITTTLPYVNSDPHIGFAMEIIRADVIARYKRLTGCEVFFNTGTDEHGAKIYENALKQGVAVQTYVDGYAAKFQELTKALGISDVHFIRTTDEKHVLAAQEMWKRCNDNGYIYKKAYQTKYCVGCELNKTDSELENGVCPIHPNREIELIDEENYFFKFSAFQKPLLDFYAANPTFVIPDFRFNEIKSFVERGLEDFSISRLKEKMPWGVAVPGDDDHVMYVWFDALTSYISTLGWGTDEKDFDFWKEGAPVQYCGKDNLRQQSAMWQAMLMAAGLPNSKHIIINGFITGADGQKMSKSIGNVISPFDVLTIYKEVTDYPEDVLRFVLLHDLSSFEDGGISLDTIKASYQANLQNGIGNFTSRIMKMAITNNLDIKKYLDIHGEKMSDTDQYQKSYKLALSEYNIKKAIEVVMMQVSWLDKDIQSNEPFKVIKTDTVKGGEMILMLVKQLAEIAHSLQPLLPQTSAKILECIHENKMPEKPLFNRFA